MSRLKGGLGSRPRSEPFPVHGRPALSLPVRAKDLSSRPYRTAGFLGDVIAIPPPLAQAISLGDIFTYGGVAVVVISGMRRRSAAEPVGRGEVQHAG